MDKQMDEQMTRPPRAAATDQKGRSTPSHTACHATSHQACLSNTKREQQGTQTLALCLRHTCNVLKHESLGMTEQSGAIQNGMTIPIQGGAHWYCKLQG
jgi:hypothetical protein